MTIDTEIRHVTKPGANLFLELGFSTEEAEQLDADVQRAIKENAITQLTTDEQSRHKSSRLATNG